MQMEFEKRFCIIFASLLLISKNKTKCIDYERVNVVNLLTNPFRSSLLFFKLDY